MFYYKYFLFDFFTKLNNKPEYTNYVLQYPFRNIRSNDRQEIKILSSIFEVLLLSLELASIIMLPTTLLFLSGKNSINYHCFLC